MSGCQPAPDITQAGWVWPAVARLARLGDLPGRHLSLVGQQREGGREGGRERYKKESEGWLILERACVV